METGATPVLRCHRNNPRRFYGMDPAENAGNEDDSIQQFLFNPRRFEECVSRFR
jgi:hypothetical protein